MDVRAKIEELIAKAQTKPERTSVARYQTVAIGVALPGSTRFSRAISASPRMSEMVGLVRVEWIRAERHDDDPLSSDTSAYLYGRGCVVSRHVWIRSLESGVPDIDYLMRPGGTLETTTKAARL